MDDDAGGSNPAGRRGFLRAGGGLLTSAWLAAHWPTLVAAHAAMTPADTNARPRAPSADADAPRFFTPAEAADVAAIAAQIVPSGATPGASEAGAAHFIDRALATFFAAMGPDFRTGLHAFQARFAASAATSAGAGARAGAGAGGSGFAAADSIVQAEFLAANDRTAFFESVRELTLLGMFSAPKYGGNRDAAGWVLLGFHDEHSFAPPFGDYDAEYTGFVPYDSGDGHGGGPVNGHGHGHGHGHGGTP